ncbi:MAG: phosphoribosylformylglycinamidine cyclo-ligase [Acidobacteria bacterium]|nr:phosphoribosylformylglycinamidine cyclo-ligase [Acidobacteriota bacterium]
MDYKSSGVDIDAGNETVRRIKQLAKATFTPGVLSDIGSFGGLFKLDTAQWREPVLVSSADGVGTKLKVAFLANRHRTIGADLVNHCVNDILVQGATPLFFLDYLATGKLSPDVAEQIVEGLAKACKDNGCALLGGETAEMPGFYAEGEYDVAGFIVGVVPRARLIDGSRIASGDVLVALPSSGLHTNGYSLARKIVFDAAGLEAGDFWPGDARTVGDVLLATHRSYLPAIRPLLPTGVIKGMAHITGGGITENLPRVLPEGLQARVETSSWTVPPVFQWLQKTGGVSDEEMRRAFNMGIGLVIVCGETDAADVEARLSAAGESPIRLGAIEPGTNGVSYR